MIRKIRLLLLLGLFMQVSLLVGAQDITMKPVSINLKDKHALQRGARIYMNYCSGCHSLQYMRYNRMARDLGLTTFDGELDEDLLKSNLIFTKASINDPIQIALLPEDAKQWFGVVPPDLSLTARSRGSLWIYNYLQSFYVDDKRPFGSNNLLFPDVAMPNVLEPLLGKMSLRKNPNTHLATLIMIEPGDMQQAEFESVLQDLVTFLVYVGEPAQLIRYKIGTFVIVFLLVFLILACKLKQAYWKKLK